MNTQMKSNELKLERFFDVPVEVVWESWNDPQQAALWWGPRGFTLTSHSKELKPGGLWHYTMHGSNGADYVNKTRYLEVQKPVKLVYDHGGNDERKPLFRVTVEFKSVKGGTLMDMTMAFPSAEDAAQSKQFIKKANGDSTWDRFAEYLTKQRIGKETFVINRTFDARIEDVYSMWTNPNHLSQWVPPTGFTMKFIEADIRPGGKTFYSMTAENGGTALFGQAEYQQLEKPHTLVYTQQFTDEKRNVSRHPMVPVWPETMLSTVKLTEETSGRTRVTVIWEALGPVKPEEQQAFINMRTSMMQGWTGSFDKLEEYLQK